jgi:hypothetical protein
MGGGGSVRHFPIVYRSLNVEVSICNKRVLILTVKRVAGFRGLSQSLSLHAPPPSLPPSPCRVIAPLGNRVPVYGSDQYTPALCLGLWHALASTRGHRQVVRPHHRCDCDNSTKCDCLECARHDRETLNMIPIHFEQAHQK